MTMENYRLHDLLKKQIDDMNRYERHYFKRVLVETMPSYITQAARVARTVAAENSQSGTNDKKNQAQTS
jgi:hypothetical protein